MTERRVKVVVTLRRAEDGAQSNWAMNAQHLDQIRAAGVEAVWTPCYTPAEVAACIRDAEVLYSVYGAFPMEAAPKLRWMHLNTASLDRLRGQPVLNSEVTITNNRGVLDINVAEHALFLILALLRRMPRMEQWRRQGVWPDGDEIRRISAGWRRPPGEVYLPEMFALNPLELFGKMVGIVGYGGIGRRLSYLLRAFGARVVVIKRNIDERRSSASPFAESDIEGVIPEQWYRPDQTCEMFARCDVAVLCQPSTPETENVIGERELQSLPRRAVLVNVGRGNTVDEEALLRALEEGWIAGAGLDVFREEPLTAASAWYGLPNVIITPHVAGASDGTQDRNVALFCQNLQRYLAGEPLLNVVDKRLRY